MQRNDGGSTGDSGQHRGSFSVGRRAYLKLAGTAAGTAGLASGSAAAAFERRGIQFERRVNMVEDAGCDPTGQDPCDAEIRNAAADSTLLVFPKGEYRITEKNAILGYTNLGFLGKGDARFRVPENFNEKLLVVDDGTGLLFEGIDIDQRASGATPALHLGASDDLRVHDVELLGQGIHPDSIPRGQEGWSPGGGAENGNPHVYDFFYPMVRSSSGTGLVTNVVANNHGLMGTYNAGNGRSGMWVGIEHEGTITFRGCRIEEFGSNGTYTSRTNGVVQFEDGIHRNNDNNQLRIGSPGSYAEGMILDVDADSSDSPNPYEALNYRGARIEMGRMNDRTDVAIRDCDIAIRSTPHSGGGVVAESTASEFTVENTRIGIEADGVRGILGKIPDGGGNYDPPAKPHAGTIRSTSVTGSGANRAAIKLRERPKSLVDNCCLNQPGSSRDGVVVERSDDCTVQSSTIDVTGEPVVQSDSQNLSVSDIDTSGSCPAPAYGAGDSLPRKLTFESNGGGFSYQFTVSGELGKSTAMGASINNNDTISGSTATGQGGGGGADSYGFTGDVLAFDVSGDVTVYLDGKRVNPGRFPKNTVTIDGNGGSSYEFAVDGDLKKSTTMGGTKQSSDTISGSSASGSVKWGRDSYSFTGDIRRFKASDSPTVYLNGSEIDTERYPDNGLTIESNGGRFSYHFAAEGALTKTTAMGATIDDNDTVSKGTAFGQGGNGGLDSYAFSGDLVAIAIDGDATAYLNRRKVDPTDYLDHVLAIDGNGSWTNYRFAASGTVDEHRGINPTESISGSSASGAVGGGYDSYAFSGDLVSLALDGDARALLDGRWVDSEEYPDHFLEIRGTGSRAEYVLSTSERITAVDVNGHDTIRANEAEGHVVGATDSYAFSGDLTRFALNGDAVVHLDGRRIHTKDYPDSLLTVDGGGSWSTYSFVVSGALDEHRGINPTDSISGTSASGGVGSGSDSYAFSGVLTRLTINNDARLELDRSERTIAIIGSGSRTNYRFRVGGGVTPLRVNDHDAVRDDGASGFVGGGRDVYRYSGDLLSLSLGEDSISVE